MSESNLNLKLADERPGNRAAPRRRRPPRFFIGGGLIACLVIVASMLFLRGGNENLVEEPVQNDGLKKEVETISPVEAKDEGQMLWVSPTAGPPISLRYVPPGSQLLLHVRMADLLSHSEGEKIVAALGPWGLQALGAIEELAGARMEEIETLLLCIHPSQSGELEYTLRCELVKSWQQDLAERFPESSRTNHVNQPLFVSKNRAHFLPEEEGGRTLVSCPLEVAAELIENGIEGPPLARDLERLLSRTDQQRDVTLVFPTKFLQTSGYELLQGSAEELRSALYEVVADDVAAVALSAHWGDDFFLELQSTLALRKRPHPFGLAVRRRMAESPAAFTKAVLGEPLPAYGEKVIARLPAMLRQVSKQTRTGEAAGISLMRCYLPISAGHNLLMAAELTLNTRVSESQARSADHSMPLSAKLRQTTTLSFPKETLQRALEMLSEDLDIPIELRGSDLQLEGITKNQSFGIDLRERPAAEILLAVLKEANPDRTASGPADIKQKLVYVVREAVNNKPGAIVVTTRSAVAREGYKLPAVFESPLP